MTGWVVGCIGCTTSLPNCPSSLLNCTIYIGDLYGTIRFDEEAIKERWNILGKS